MIKEYIRLFDLLKNSFGFITNNQIMYTTGSYAKGKSLTGKSSNFFEVLMPFLNSMKVDAIPLYTYTTLRVFLKTNT